MIWILAIVVAGMTYRFVNAVSKCEWSMIWYAVELMALVCFLRSLMI